MNEPSQIPNATSTDVELARERTKQMSIAGWTGGLSAFFAAATLASHPTWPVAAGVAGVSLMITVICYAMLRR